MLRPSLALPLVMPEVCVSKWRMVIVFQAVGRPAGYFESGSSRAIFFCSTSNHACRSGNRFDVDLIMKTDPAVFGTFGSTTMMH
jgi:hypothetical protein